MRRLPMGTSQRDPASNDGPNGCDKDPFAIFFVSRIGEVVSEVNDHKFSRREPEGCSGSASRHGGEGYVPRWGAVAASKAITGSQYEL